jgi:hypothetical protein
MQSLLLSTSESPASASCQNGGVTVRHLQTTPLKNSNRIDEISCRMSVGSSNVFFLSASTARTVRRDWNIVCSKMYVFSLNSSYQKRIQDDLTELHWQIADLADITGTDLFTVQDLNWLAPVHIEIRIVSPMASSLLRALQSWDLSVAKLLTAERNGMIDKLKRQAMLSAVNMAYIGFKGTAMKLSMKNTKEMLEESHLI